MALTNEKDFAFVDRPVEKQKSKLDAEVERLEKENHELMVECIRAEAIKEFAERYKEHIKSFTGKFDEDGFYVSLQAVLSAVDFIKKEMVGDV